MKFTLDELLDVLKLIGIGEKQQIKEGFSGRIIFDRIADAEQATIPKPPEE